MAGRKITPYDLAEELDILYSPQIVLRSTSKALDVYREDPPYGITATGLSTTKGDIVFVCVSSSSWREFYAPSGWTQIGIHGFRNQLFYRVNGADEPNSVYFDRDPTSAYSGWMHASFGEATKIVNWNIEGNTYRFEEDPVLEITTNPITPVNNSLLLVVIGFAISDEYPSEPSGMTLIDKHKSDDNWGRIMSYQLIEVGGSPMTKTSTFPIETSPMDAIAANISWSM